MSSVDLLEGQSIGIPCSPSSWTDQPLYGFAMQTPQGNKISLAWCTTASFAGTLTKFWKIHHAYLLWMSMNTCEMRGH